MSKDTLVTSAFLAAVRQLEKAFVFSDLAEIRRNRIRKLAGSTMLREPKARPAKPKIPVFLPVVQIEKAQGFQKPKFRMLPFVYLNKVTANPYLPFMEIIELPLLDVPCQEGSLSELEAQLEHIAIPFPVTFSKEDKSTSLADGGRLWKIRMAIAREVFALGGREIPAYLNLVATETFGAGEAGSYLAGLAASLRDAPLEKHRTRLVPVFTRDGFCTVSIESFVLSTKVLQGTAF